MKGHNATGHFFSHYKDYAIGHLFFFSMIELRLRHCMDLYLKNICTRGNDYSIDVYGKPDVFVSFSLVDATHEVYKKKR